jgi:hypothetical protein
MRVKIWLVCFLFPVVLLDGFALAIAYPFIFPRGIGFFLNDTAEEERVNLRVVGLMRLASEANVDF